MVFMLLGCQGKEYKKPSNDNISIIEDLNKGNPEAVIMKLQGVENISARERYYLASAYSSQGGVDVFSLYSVLELQLFRKNALEWSDLSKEQNPYLRFMRSQEGVNQETRQKKREERWARFEARLIETNNFRLTKPTIDDVKSAESYDRHKITQELYDRADRILAKKFDEIMKLPQDLDERSLAWDNFENLSIYTQEEGEEIAGIEYMTLAQHYSSRIRFETMKANYLHPEKSGNVFGNVKWEMIYMNVLWNTYEAIPIMKQMPTLSVVQQEKVTSALTEYRKLLRDPEFRPVALKNLAVLVGVSILSIYKESFEFDEIQDAQDLMCSFSPDAIVNNYRLIRQRILFLSEVLEESSGIQEIQQYKPQIQAFRDSLAEELSQDQKDRYFSDVDVFKLRSCFSN
jgi:hypothetical protein